MKSKLGDIARFNHILQSINEIEQYLVNQTYEDFINNSMMKNATVRQLEIIGEAVTKISDETKAEYIDVDWKAIGGMRNILIHEYFGVNYSLVWKTVKNDLERLKIISLEFIEKNSSLF